MEKNNFIFWLEIIQGICDRDLVYAFIYSASVSCHCLRQCAGCWGDKDESTVCAMEDLMV